MVLADSTVQHQVFGEASDERIGEHVQAVPVDVKPATAVSGFRSVGSGQAALVALCGDTLDTRRAALFGIDVSGSPGSGNVPAII
jgi:hypothetical protein